MQLPDLALIGALVMLVVVVLLVAWRLRPGGGTRRRSNVRGMGRDDSISYFRDFNRPAGGVREEDRSGRWGGDD